MEGVRPIQEKAPGEWQFAPGPKLRREVKHHAVTEM